MRRKAQRVSTEWDAKEVANAFDLKALPDDFYANPYRTYAALREHAPVKRLPDGSVFLTRYADILQVYKNPQQFFSDKKAEFGPKFGDTPLFEHHTTSLVFNDPPLHTRVRRLIMGALTPKAIAAMEPALHALAAQLLDAMSDKARKGVPVDLIEDYATAIPIEVIGNLLQVPPAERAPLRQWSVDILTALEPQLSPAQHAAGNAAVRDFCAYLRSLVARRRAAPGDPQTDVLTKLIQGEHTANGHEVLSEIELLQNCIFLLNAGHETTTNLIGNGLAALATAPDARAQLQAQPDAHMRTAIEEFLRYESSNQLGNRTAAEDCDIGGEVIRAGTYLHLCIGAANRDPAQFPAPDVLDIARDPNRHLAFGSGVHQCAGNHLARLEASVAVTHFLKRFPHYTLAGEPVRRNRARFRGFSAIPLAGLA
jgi:cytochrome P450